MSSKHRLVDNLDGVNSGSDRMLPNIPTVDDQLANDRLYLERIKHKNFDVLYKSRFFRVLDLKAVDIAFDAALKYSGGRITAANLNTLVEEHISTPMAKCVRYDSIGRRVFTRVDDGEWFVDQSSSNYDFEPAQMAFVLSTLWPALFTAADAATQRAAKNILDAITYVPQSADELRLQFDDAVLTPRGLESLESSSNALPAAYMIERAVTHLDGLDKPKIRVKAVDELLLAIAAGDEPTRDRLLDMCAMAFVFRADMKEHLGKLCFLYGTGGNGKSLFLNLFRSALGGESESSLAGDFDLAHFKGFSTESMIGKLALIDEDCSGRHLDREVVANLKKLSNAGTLTVHRKYRADVGVKSLASVFAAGNELPTSDDKTDGWLRRFEIYNLPEKLPEHTQLWYDEIRSEKAATYLFELLVCRALRILSTGEITPMSERMLRDVEEYKLDNSSVLRWLEEVDPEKDVFWWKPKDVHTRYLEWCGDSETRHAISSFRTQICNVLGASVEQVYLRRNEQLEQFMHYALEKAQPDAEYTQVRVFVPLQKQERGASDSDDTVKPSTPRSPSKTSRKSSTRPKQSKPRKRKS